MTGTKLCACGKKFTPRSNHQIHCHRRCHNPENYNGLLFTDAQRNYKYKINYGITLEDYNRMFAEQEGCCKICKRHQTEFNKKLHVDHKHETGVVRGLLCHNCNLALGRVNENPKILKAMLEYIS